MTMKDILMDNYDLQVDMAKRIFLEYDQERMIGKFCLEADDQWIYLTYLNSPCRICRQTGRVEERKQDIWTQCRDYSTVMTIYDLLCFHKGDAAPVLAGSWCSAGSFVVTGVNAHTFTKKYANLFNGRLAELKKACEALGGVLQPAIAGADVTCLFPVTSFFPVLFQFWEGDEEFPPKLMLLWDRNADRFLHYETTFYLQGDLLERLWKIFPEL